MSATQKHFLWLTILILGALTLSPALRGQAVTDSAPGQPMVSDWRQHHLIASKSANSERSQRVAPLKAVISAERFSSKNVSGAIHATKGTNGYWSQDLGSGATVGATNYPAKFSFRGTSATCATGPGQPDFVVFGTGVQGSSTQANIVAYTNLYSGCTGTVPTVYWAYNVSDSTIVTSPVLSDDGTQVAWVQRDPAGQGIVILLKWAASGTETVGNPLTVLHVVHGSYPTCTAPCWTSFALGFMGTIHSDSNSSVFYDYNTDTGYVGDDAGFLHKFMPFFKAVPAEIKTGGWPVQMNPTSPTALNSPVQDYASQNVFVTDNGGFLYLVSSTAVVTQSGQLDFSAANDLGPGIVQGPIVDSTSGLVYVFAASDGSGSGPGGADYTAVYQLSTSFIAGGTGTEARVGSSTVEPTTPSPLYIGAFDSTYENSVNATGDLYVCGNTGGPPILYQVAIGAGVLGTVNPGPVLSTSIPPTPCSPVTDILNPNASGGPTEWMFASAENDGASSACASGGCIFNFKDTPWLPSTGYVVGQEIVDSNFHTEFVSTPGTSGTAAPFWDSAQGGLTTDHTVKWLDLGPPSAFPLAVWRKAQHYSIGAEILDGNSNIEIATTAGTTGTPNPPVWNLTVGGTTHDGTVTWTNVGAPPTAALAADGGTSGIIIDNIVGSGTLVGASQIYFSTLNGGCGVGNADGCAVQASQSALQ
jgi:hypothetical protein